MATFIDSLLDLIVDFIPWRPAAWDVPIMDWSSTSMWSEAAHRWVQAP